MFEAMDLAMDMEIDQEIAQEIAQDIDLQITSVETLKDPFLTMSQELDSTTSSKIDFGGNGIQHRSLEELLIDRGLTASSPSQMKSGEILKREMIDSSSADIQPTIDVPMKATDFADGAIELAKSASDQLNASTFGEQKSDGQGFEQDLDQGTGDTLRDLATPIADGFKYSRDNKVSFANKLASADVTPNRESISEKILGHAQMMVKNGGGSMRVDVEAPGIGKVDVAINLINNQLDVRIITSSEQARDIIAKEVAGLRDGLTQQGISLRGLEVGKAGDSSPRHFSGQGNQQFGQGAQDQRATYNDMKEYVQSFKNSYSTRPSHSAPASAPSLGRWTNLGSGIAGNSRLEVRV
jgi:flagellar hook-length control protein FliK